MVELRLAPACTLTQAQRVLDRFLPRFNARFAQAPAHPEPAWRPAPADLDRICCFMYRRTVQHDNTVRLKGRLLQLRPGPGDRSYTGLRVNVYAHLNGTLAVAYHGQRLASTVLPPGQRPSQRPQVRFPEGKPGPTIPLPPTDKHPPREIPPANHPWRRMITEDIWRQRHRPKVTRS